MTYNVFVTSSLLNCWVDQYKLFYLFYLDTIKIISDVGEYIICSMYIMLY